jgi:hypothetical protein
VVWCFQGFEGREGSQRSTDIPQVDKKNIWGGSDQAKDWDCTLEIENLDHLGLVAALVNEIGLAELTDEVLAPHPLNHISPGQVVKAMILDGLGFVSAPL